MIRPFLWWRAMCILLVGDNGSYRPDICQFPGVSIEIPSWREVAAALSRRRPPASAGRFTSGICGSVWFRINISLKPFIWSHPGRVLYRLQRQALKTPFNSDHCCMKYQLKSLPSSNNILSPLSASRPALRNSLNLLRHECLGVHSSRGLLKAETQQAADMFPIGAAVSFGVRDWIRVYMEAHCASVRFTPESPEHSRPPKICPSRVRAFGTARVMAPHP